MSDTPVPASFPAGGTPDASASDRWRRPAGDGHDERGGGASDLPFAWLLDAHAAGMSTGSAGSDGRAVDRSARVADGAQLVREVSGQGGVAGAQGHERRSAGHDELAPGVNLSALAAAELVAPRPPEALDPSSLAELQGETAVYDQGAGADERATGTRSPAPGSGSHGKHGPESESTGRQSSSEQHRSPTFVFSSGPGHPPGASGGNAEQRGASQAHEGDNVNAIGQARSAASPGVDQAAGRSRTTVPPPVNSAGSRPLGPGAGGGADGGKGLTLGSLRAGNTGASVTRAPSAPSPDAGFLHAEDEGITATIGRGLAAAMRQKGGLVTIQLNPESLGHLKIRIGIEGGTVSARFEASTAEARDLLTENLDSLKAALEARGLQVDRLQVETIARTEASDGPGARQENAGRPLGERSSDERPPRDGREPADREAGSGDNDDPRHGAALSPWLDAPLTASSGSVLRLDTVA